MSRHRTKRKPDQLTSGQCDALRPGVVGGRQALAFGDKDGRVSVYRSMKRSSSRLWTPRGADSRLYWSPKGHHLAFSMAAPTPQLGVHLEREGQSVRRITDELSTPGILPGIEANYLST